MAEKEEKKTSGSQESRHERDFADRITGLDPAPAPVVEPDSTDLTEAWAPAGSAGDLVQSLEIDSDASLVNKPSKTTAPAGSHPTESTSSSADE